MSSAPLPRSAKVGYGLGSFCAGTFSAVPGLLLLYYMTNTLAVPAALAGVAVFVPKVWDLVANPYVGRLSDRTRSRHGPRRPWLLAGAVALPPVFALTFAGPSLTGWAAGLYVGGCFFLAATAFALFEVPYKAMPAEMTDDHHEQSSLLTWRMAFLGMAVLISGALAPAIVNMDGGDPTLKGYRLMGLVIAAMLAAAMVATFAGTAKAPRLLRAEAEHTPLRWQLWAARDNRAFTLLLALSAAQMLAVGMMLAGAPYFATYVLEDSDAIATLFLAIVGPLVVTMPLWVRWSRRLGKPGAMVLGSLLFLGGSAGMGLTPALGNGFAHLCAVVVGVGYAGMQLMQFSMLADTLVADVLESGKRRAGVLTGLWTAAETVMMAFGALLLAGMLALAGFVSSEPDKPVAQPDSAVNAVLAGGTVVPAVLIGLAIWLTRRYDLTAERMAELHAQQAPSAAGS